MSPHKAQATVADAIAGTTLIILGFVGMLVRLGVLTFSQAPQWSGLEQWWPLLLIIVGLVVWLIDMETAEPAHASQSVEMPYGK